jgi:hypothetical protein
LPVGQFEKRRPIKRNPEVVINVKAKMIHPITPLTPTAEIVRSITARKSMLSGFDTIRKTIHENRTIIAKGTTTKTRFLRTWGLYRSRGIGRPRIHSRLAITAQNEPNTMKG